MPSIDLSGVREFSHVESPDGTQKGARNDSLYRYACSLQAQGVSDEGILAECMGVASTMEPPLDSGEVVRVVRSALSYQKGSSSTLGRRREAPRSVPPVPRFARTGHPERLPDWSGVSPIAMARAWVMALFEPQDVVCLAWDLLKGYQGGRGGEIYAYAAQLADPTDPLLRQLVEHHWEKGLWGVVNPLDGSGKRKGANVTAYRNLLVECDDLKADQQLERICALLMNGGSSGLPDSVAVTWSGGKSWHAVVRVNSKDAREYETFKEWVYGMCAKNGLPIDSKCGNPNRFTRVAGAMRGDVRQVLTHCRKPSGAWRGTPADWAERG